MAEMTLIDAAITGGTVVGAIVIFSWFLYFETIRSAKKEARKVVKDKVDKHERYKHN